MWVLWVPYESPMRVYENLMRTLWEPYENPMSTLWKPLFLSVRSTRAVIPAEWGSHRVLCAIYSLVHRAEASVIDSAWIARIWEPAREKANQRKSEPKKKAEFALTKLHERVTRATWVSYLGIRICRVSSGSVLGSRVFSIRFASRSKQWEYWNRRFQSKIPIKNSNEMKFQMNF